MKPDYQGETITVDDILKMERRIIYLELFKEKASEYLYLVWAIAIFTFVNSVCILSFILNMHK